MKQFSKTSDGLTWWWADFKGVFQRMVPAHNRTEALTICRKFWGYPTRLKRQVVK